MPKAYQRKLIVRIGTAEFASFDCAFSITRTLDMFANTASITVYNLSSESRKAIHAQVQGVDCEIRAGYENDPELFKFFRGNLRVISSRRQGTDWVTTVESGDGDIVSQADVSKSFPDGFSIKSVVTDLVTSVKAEAGNLVAALSGVPDKQTQGPTTVHGSVNDILADNLDKLGLEHSWQDNGLQILKKSQPLNGDTAVYLTPTTGMLDSPEIQGIRGFVRVPIVNVSSLLNPQITPGRLIKVESAIWTGSLAARRVTHQGQSWGGEWRTDVEGLVISNGV